MKAIFLDIETTGLDPLVHKPIDIALKIINLTTDETEASYQSLILQPPSTWNQHDPVSLEINGYSPQLVAQGKQPATIKTEIINLFQKHNIQRGKAVFICQNPAFDRSFFIQIIDVYTQERLNWPYHWLDLASMYWAILAKHQNEHHLPFPNELSLSKNAIANLYNIPNEPQPHHALQGVEHLITCYKSVLSQTCHT